FVLQVDDFDLERFARFVIRERDRRLRIGPDLERLRLDRRAVHVERRLERAGGAVRTAGADVVRRDRQRDLARLLVARTEASAALLFAAAAATAAAAARRSGEPQIPVDAMHQARRRRTVDLANDPAARVRDRQF